MTDAQRLLEALFPAMPEDERAVLCGFRGDPNAATPASWKPWAWRPGRGIDLDPHGNGYVCVATVHRNDRGQWRRRKENFAAAWALMVDDVGTKVDRDKVAALAPTAVVETSPGNEQWWYAFEEPVRDRATFERLVAAFIAERLLGADPGMSGAMRVGRLPGFVNGKPKYHDAEGRPFRTRLLALETTQRFTPQRIAHAFGLRVEGAKVSKRAAMEVLLRQLAGAPAIHPAELASRRAAFDAHLAVLRRAGMLKRHEPDLSGWMEIRCPWLADHTDRADSGAAVREPSEENGWYGAFRCHHGHCAGKGWRDLTDWIDEEVTEQLFNNEGADQ